MKFKYSDKIEVVSGFYKGMKGEIDDYIVRNNQIYYYIEPNFFSRFSSHFINEKHLKLIEKK